MLTTSIAYLPGSARNGRNPSQQGELTSRSPAAGGLLRGFRWLLAFVFGRAIAFTFEYLLQRQAVSCFLVGNDRRFCREKRLSPFSGEHSLKMLPIWACATKKSLVNEGVRGGGISEFPRTPSQLIHEVGWKFQETEAVMVATYGSVTRVFRLYVSYGIPILLLAGRCFLRMVCRSDCF